MDRNLIVGDWSIGLREFTIVDESGSLLLRCPDAPPGYEGRLVEMSDDRLRIEGGPLHGAVLIIAGDGPSLGGYLPLTRLERKAAASPGSGVTVDTAAPDRAEEEAFVTLWNWLAHPSRPAEVDTGGLDACRFVRWLSARQLALFHGTGRLGLDILEPPSGPPLSMGVADVTEIVYATEDALCSMFLALADASAGGRHRVERFYSVGGEHIDVYHFSLASSAMRADPFRPGGLYLLPREGFHRAPLYPGGPASPEWFASEPVRPLGCLIVTPDDFPLRDQVGYYDHA